MAEPYPPPVDPVDHDNDDARSDVSDLDPDSAVLAPVQERIGQQLRRDLEQLSLELHEATNEARLMRQRREDCGVELYNVQQHLAKLQETLEKGHDNLAAIQQLREEKELERQRLSDEVGRNEQEIADQRRRYVKYQQQLDKLNETLLTAEEFNKQIQSEIQIERRAAYKAEDDIAKLESDKARQDGLVDALNERIKGLSEQHAHLAAQVAAQKQETKMARDTLAEALAEMEAVSFEKKMLMQQWRTSIVGMQRRDEALKATEEALAKQREALLTLDAEIVGHRDAIKRAQTENAKLSGILSKTEAEVASLEKQIDAQLETKRTTTERFNLLKRSMEQADEIQRQQEQRTRALQAEISTVKKKIEKKSQEVVDKEQKVLHTLSQQTTLKKGSQAALQEIEVMKNKIREKELHVAQMENELARIRVDTLQTQAHNDVLKQTVAELEKELQSRDSLVEKMQQDIRRKHDEIERKQKQLDGLNRQYESIVAAHGAETGEHVGPLEATVNNLSRAIAQKSSENDALQRTWIKLQTELVQCSNENQELQDGIQELRAQTTILQQKRNRLESATAKQRDEIKDLDRAKEQLHLELQRLNTLLSKNATSQEHLANETWWLQTDVVRRLAERQKEALQLEEKVAGIRAAKKELMEQILDAERGVMYWEKKIQIARETELALDPNVGKDEIHRMRREIYIMEQRLAHLQREQRRRVEEMQKLIDHRDVLRTKGMAVQQAALNSNQRTLTKATVSKENQRLAAELTAKKQEAQSKDQQIKDLLTQTERTAQAAEDMMRDADRLRAELEEAQQEVAASAATRDRMSELKARRQRALQRYRDAERGVYAVSARPDEVAERTAQVRQQQEALRAAVGEIVAQHPELGPELRAIIAGAPPTAMTSA
jgi:chromosome segregation ATPase